MPFPRNALDVSTALLRALGDFWAGVYQGRSLIADLLLSAQQLTQRSYLRFDDFLAALNRTTCPLTRRRPWSRVRLAAAEASGLGLPPFGSGGTFDGSRQFSGEPFWGFSAPAGLSRCRLLVPTLLRPAFALYEGADYDLDVERGLLKFKADPFLDPRHVQADVDNDRVITLFAAAPEFNDDRFWKRFGVSLSLPGSSEPVRNAFNAAYEAHLAGVPLRDLVRYLGACLSAPVATADEVVESVVTDARGQHVVTPTRVYDAAPGAELSVAAGDTTETGRSLSSAVEMLECARVPRPSPERLRGLTLPREQLGEGYLRGLYFANEDVPLTVEPPSDATGGYTKVSFALTGWSGDVTRFWDEVHTQGVAAGQTLAMLLDRRGGSPAGQPTADDLPTTINPLHFLFQNVLRCHGAVAVVRAGQCRATLAEKALLRKTASLVPAWAGLFVAVELRPFVEDFTIGSEEPVLRPVQTFTETMPSPADDLRLVAPRSTCS